MSQSLLDTICPPLDGRIIRLTVAVPRFDSWDAAIMAGTPDTRPQPQLKIHRIGNQFAIPEARPHVRLILMWAGPDSKTSPIDASSWGRRNGLLSTNPYTVFAVSALARPLHELFSCGGGVGLVATEQQMFESYPNVCGVYHSKKTGERRAGVSGNGFHFLDRTLFAFEEPLG
ncbi:MAG: hypothetical protein AB199_03755 [Parcubacteria bacterium C7867-004]|nr:MAG: hypothetical protein AB199_03755 [Parcubacteria bacterium C7867-004]